jgi:hypothetical protein
VSAGTSDAAYTERVERIQQCKILGMGHGRAVREVRLHAEDRRLERPSGGSESTFRFDFLLNARGNSM